MTQKRKWIIVPILIAVIYLMGPRPPAPAYKKELPSVPDNPALLEKYILDKESQHPVKPDNEARIIWADDSLRQKTPYAIVYLHGFSASQGEGDPVHRTIAKKFGCNLFLSRLAEHGLDTTEQLVGITADKLWESAQEALAIASQLGERVILMGTSTGGTLALLLSANYPEISANILLSPNIAIFDGRSRILSNPWGVQIGRLVTGSKYIYAEDTRPIYKQYWNYGYRLEAVANLEKMLETSMTPATFKKVKQPVLLLYYYKDEVHQDSVVRVDAMQKMFSELGTPADKKRATAMPMAGNHVMGSYIKSRDVDGVIREIARFMTEVLGMKEKVKD